MSATRQRWIFPAALALLLATPQDAWAQLPRTQPATEAEAFDLASKYQNLAAFDQAAERYEAAARAYPKSARAPAALNDAIFLRMGLRQTDKAADDVSLFARYYGASKAAELAKLALGLGLFHEEVGEFAQAKKWLEAWMARIDRAGTLDIRIRAHAALGQAASKLGDAKSAEREYAVVRASWNDPAAATKEIVTSGGTVLEQDRRLAQALTAVGEALFFFAEQKRSLADAASVPQLKGVASAARLETHINKTLTEWMKKKRVLIEEAEREYLAVLALQPEAPPRWMIASSFQVGTLWARFDADTDLKSFPLPDERRGRRSDPRQEALGGRRRERAYPTCLRGVGLRERLEEAKGESGFPGVRQARHDLPALRREQ